MRKLLFAFLCFSMLLVNGQQKDRPVVGLVLSGGGAKGFAHIGVLKVIDSLGIPIDYVGGTSMGAVVGGMYAIGHTPDQIAEIVESIDWADVMVDQSKRAYMTPINKKTEGRYLFKTQVKGFEVIAPSGFISGHKMLAELNRFTQGYHGNRDFMNDFPRKFLCVSTNIRTGEEVVHTSGSLPDVIRASVSIPTMFTPYRIDGELQADGGSVNNFPSDHLKELGCDIIIGISVQSPEPDSLTLVSMVEVVERVGMLMDTKTNDARKKLSDVLINPDMQGYGLTDFEYNKQIIKLGEEEAHVRLPDLEKIANLFSEQDRLEVEPYKRVDSIYVAKVSVVGASTKKKDVVEDKFGVQPGAYHSIQELEYRRNIVYGTNHFKQVQYKLYPLENGQYEVEVVVKEKVSDSQVGINVHYDSDFRAAIGLNFTQYDFLKEGTALGVDLLIRENMGARVFYDFDRGYYPGFYFESRFYNARPNIYSMNEYVGDLGYSDWANFLALQSSYKRKYNFKLGIGLDYQKFNFERLPDWVSDPINRGDSSKVKAWHVHWLKFSLELDNLDNRDFPNEGARVAFNGSITHLIDQSTDLFDSEPFIPLSFDYVQAFTTNKWLAIIPRARAGFTFLNESSFAYKHLAGSFGRNHINYNRPFVGYRFIELAVNENGETYYPQNIITTECALRANTGKFGYFAVFAGLGTASHDVDMIFSKYFGGIGASYSLKTVFGPIRLIVHKSTESNNTYGYINFGYWL